MLAGTIAHDKSGASVAGSIPNRTTSDITEGNNKVTIPAGHYAGNVEVTAINTSDATATSDQLYKGATAYVNGQKIIGTAEVTVRNEEIIIPAGLVTPITE